MTTPALTLAYPGWAELYPELAANVSPAQFNAYVSRSPLIATFNTTSSPVQDQAPGGLLERLLYLLLSHYAVLAQRDPNQVGAITDASQGSVHVAFDTSAREGTARWYRQTQYGADFWNAIAPLRSAVWRSPVQPFRIPYPAA